MKLYGLYAITGTDTHLADVREALSGGVRILQYRDKYSTEEQRMQMTQKLQRLCKSHQVIFIVNDDVELAMAVNADGVHLGAQDTSISDARARLGEEKLIGVSCYNSLERARKAAALGADYLAFGAFFSSPTKPNAVCADIALLRQAKQFKLPLVAIGGISPQNGSALIKAGADMLAVISGIFSTKAIQQAAKAYSELFTRQSI